MSRLIGDTTVYHALLDNEDAAEQPLLTTTATAPPTPPKIRFTLAGPDYKSVSTYDADHTSRDQHVYVKTAAQVALLIKRLEKAREKDKAGIIQQMHSLLQAAEAYETLFEEPASKKQQQALNEAKTQQAKAEFLVMTRRVSPREDNFAIRKDIHTHLKYHYDHGMKASDFRTLLTRKQQGKLDSAEIYLDVHTVIAALEEDKKAAKHEVFSPRPR
ncbi:MAG: hypothetical protein P1U63_05450 [Coxiellaceae bacterium]|nr:hypothetical protein [Coxiellaceae bacterium]